MTPPTVLDKAACFRALHERAGGFVIPNPWDAGSARILQSLGFEALATTSGGLAWSLGQRDGQVTLEDKLRHCRALVAATDLPVAADLGKGFGDSPEAAADTILRSGETGIAGGSIEDANAVYGGALYPLGHAVERVAAAVEAASRLPQDFILTARCEMFALGGSDFDAAVERLKAYEDAGADVLYAPGMTDLGQIRTLCQEVARPVNVLVGFTGMSLTPDQLIEAGVKRVSVGTQLSRIAYGAFLRAAEELKATGTVRDHDVDVRSSAIAKHFT